jgi:hypothetical protein
MLNKLITRQCLFKTAPVLNMQLRQFNAAIHFNFAAFSSTNDSKARRFWADNKQKITHMKERVAQRKMEKEEIIKNVWGCSTVESICELMEAHPALNDQDNMEFMTSIAKKQAKIAVNDSAEAYELISNLISILGQFERKEAASWGHVELKLAASTIDLLSKD